MALISPERDWYRFSLLSLLLLPAALLFRIGSALRRGAYAVGILRSIPVGVPVIVVGNLTAGGTGKTPVVIWLVEHLRSQGFQPGIISRGYGGRGQMREVDAQTPPEDAGDEPAMLAGRCACPVWVGRDRVATARALLSRHRNCDVLVSDDGLQHYRLARAVEIAVTDAGRGLGNGLPLPAGPLREPASRLDSVDAVVVHGGESAPDQRPPRFSMALEGSLFRNVRDPASSREAGAFRGLRVHAVAGIGHPQRFFAALRRMGLEFQGHPFPDHHAFTAADLDFPGAQAILMTEKDAIKCRRFARPDMWMLPVQARIPPGFGQLVAGKLKAPHGS